MFNCYLDGPIAILGEGILFNLPMQFTLTFQIYNKIKKPILLTK